MNKYEKQNVENRITQERVDAAGLQYRTDAKLVKAAHTAGTQKGILIGGAIATLFYLLLCATYMVLRAWGIIQII